MPTTSKNPPAGGIEQVETTGSYDSGDEQITHSWKFPGTTGASATSGWAQAVAAAAGYEAGDEITGFPGLVSTINVSRLPGGVGVLSLSFEKPKTSTGTPSAAKALKTTWAMDFAQAQVSAMRYAGISASSSCGLRVDIERWRAEREGDLYRNYQWRDETGAINTLGTSEQKLAKKLLQGKESVLRFYPVEKKVTVYSSARVDGVGASLAYIGTPGGPWDSAASAWLKVGDSITQNSDGTYTRTEQWQGADSWDVNFYGSGGDRWAFET